MGGSAVLDGVFSYGQGDEGLSSGFQEEILRKECKFPEVGMFGYSRNSKEASGAGIEMKKGGIVGNRLKGRQGVRHCRLWEDLDFYVIEKKGMV